MPKCFTAKTCVCSSRVFLARGHQGFRKRDRLGRVGASKKGYDFESDSIFSSKYALTHEAPSPTQPMDVRLPNGVFMGGEDFFSDIEEWVDFGNQFSSQYRCEELNGMKKISLQAICQKAGLGWRGRRQTLIRRILKHESTDEAQVSAPYQLRVV